LQAVIIAGGQGTRLGALTKEIPKPLVPVVGRPFLDRQLELLASQGIDQVVLCIGHFGGQIREFVGNGSHWGLEAAFSEDGPTLLGTGGCLKKAEPLLAERFFMIWGDSYLLLDYGQVWRNFLDSGLAGLMVVWRNQGQKEPSNVRLSGNKVASYDKWSPSPEFDCIDYGLSAFDHSVLERIPRGQPYAIEQVFVDLATEGRLAAHVVEHPYFEIGSPAGLAELEQYILQQEGQRP